MKDETTAIIGSQTEGSQVEVKQSAEGLPQPTESEVLQKEKDLNYIGLKEFKALKKSKYQEKMDSFDKTFVLKNKRTGAIVEIGAVNTFQACKFIGWKPKQVVLLETKEVEKKEIQENDENE